VGNAVSCAAVGVTKLRFGDVESREWMAVARGGAIETSEERGFFDRSLQNLIRACLS
jgi:hypothetical protein